MIIIKAHQLMVKLGKWAVTLAVVLFEAARWPMIQAICVPRPAISSLRTIGTTLSGFVLFAPPIEHWITELWHTETPYPLRGRAGVGV